MSQQKLTDRTQIPQGQVSHDLLVHFVDPNDTNQDAAGSSFNGSLNQVGILMHSRNRVAYVDNNFGDDLLGLVYRADRPFKTLKAAQDALVALTIPPGGDATVWCRPALYDTTTDNELIGYHGINYHFEDGCYFNGNDFIFSDALLSAGQYFSVSGNGTFASDVGIVDQANGSKVYFQCKNINVIGTSPAFSGTASSILYLDCEEINNTQAATTQPIFYINDLTGQSIFYISAKKIHYSDANTASMFKIRCNDSDSQMYINCPDIQNEFAGKVVEVVKGGYVEINGRVRYGTGTAIKGTADGSGTGKIIINGSIHSDSANAGSIKIDTAGIEVQCYAKITGNGFIDVTIAGSTVRLFKDVIVTAGARAAVLVAAVAAAVYAYNCTIENLTSDNLAHTVELTDATSTFVTAGTTLKVNTANATSRSIYSPVVRTYHGKAMFANRALHGNVTNLLAAGVEVIDANIL